MTLPADFSERIAESRARHLSPAIAAVAVTADGRMLTAAHGPVRPSDSLLWHIGSCTKAMTATLIARLVQTGRMSFDDSLGDALPDLADTMSAAFRATTLRAVLTHSAGLPSDPDEGTYRRLRTSGAPATELRRFLARKVLAEAPRAESVYSNLGYIVAGAAVERATGRSWEAMLAREVMVPLGIARFGFGPPGRGHPTGHRRREDRWRAYRGDNPPAYGPAGRVHLSMEEWGRFLRAHLRESGFLPAASLETLHSAAPNGFAMGWIVGEHGGERRLLHTGSNTAWFAQAMLVPGRGLGLGVVCNAYDSRIEDAVGDLCRALADEPGSAAP